MGSIFKLLQKQQKVLNIVDNSLFPAPEPSYDTQTFTTDPLIEYIPSDYEQSNDQSKIIMVKLQKYIQIYKIQKAKDQKHIIPLLIIPYKEQNGQKSDKYMLYFHGNGEDIGLSYQFLQSMQTEIKMNIIAVDYPGYGIYQTRKTSSDCIKSEALTVYDFICNNPRYKTSQNKIVILGRSIGSGPACYLASQRNPRALILISPFASIKRLISHHVCACISCFISERFNNIGCMDTVASPVLLIHGQKDTLIPPINSQMLELRLTSQKKIVQAIYHSHMTHNQFDEKNDVSIKIKEFLAKV